MPLKNKNSIAMLLAILVSANCSHRSVNQTLDLTPHHRAIANELHASTSLLNFAYTEQTLQEACQYQIDLTKKQLLDWEEKYSTSAAITVQVLLDYEEIKANLSDRLTPLTFLARVSKDKSLRRAASQCRMQSATFEKVLTTSRHYYDIIKQVLPTHTQEVEKRLLQVTLESFERSGMGLSDEDLKKYKDLSLQGSKLRISFRQNLNEDTSVVTLTEAELVGVKNDFLNRLTKDKQNHYIVTTKEPDYNHIMENAQSSETRKKMYYAFHNRQSTENTFLLQEIIQVRDQIGKLMGFASYADYALQNKMAKNSQNVLEFLKELKKQLRPLREKELAQLTQFSQKNLKNKNPLNIWDLPYVSNQFLATNYHMDKEQIREYFPLPHVLNTMMEIYSQLLGVQFRKVDGASVWDENVQAYEVKDIKTQKVKAYFYTDLLPRKGKFGGAMAVSLIGGRQLLKDGVYQNPVAALVANFLPPGINKPVLLSHEELKTLFHEFGHIMHNVLTQVPYKSLSGTKVLRDFVEAPSQMLENWIWDKDVLQKISQHYLTQKSLPLEIVEALQKTKQFNRGLQYTRQLVFALFDMSIHTDPSMDVTKEYAEIHQELFGLAPLEGTHFPATFGHLMGGYAAGYYGYLWSKAFAAEMFSEFHKNGILNPKIGYKYRSMILEQGNKRDPSELMKNFLGRDPSLKNFFKNL